MSEQLQFFKGNTEEALEAKAGSYIPGAIYHCLDTGNTYLATSTTDKQLFATTNPEENIKKATQNAAITTNADYPVILASGTATTNITDVLNKTSTLKYNPSTGALTTKKIIVTANYGNTLPSSGTEGEIFLLLVE